MAVLRCKEPFSADVDGVPRTIAANTLIDSTDPIVKGRENLFEPVGVATRTASVEQATAAPGEKRSVSRKAGS